MSADELYHGALKQLAETSRGQGRLDHPDATATVDNPLCGDRVTVDVSLDGDRVTAIGHEVKGCLLCEAAAALVTEVAAGHAKSELADLPQQVKAYLKTKDDDAPFPGLEPFAPARAFRSRHRCVSLPFEALVKALG